MEEEVSFELSEPSGTIYNIKHRAFYFSKNIIHFIREQQYDKIYFSLFDQLLRSATSIGANLVEGVAGSSKMDFIKFNVIALKSSNETKYWLCLIRDTLQVEQTAVENLIKEADEISKIIASIIINSKKQ